MQGRHQGSSRASSSILKLPDQAKPIATVDICGIPSAGQKIQVRRRGTPIIYVIVNVLHVVDEVRVEPIPRTANALIPGKPDEVSALLAPARIADRPTIPIVVKPEGHTIELLVRPYHGEDD